MVIACGGDGTINEVVNGLAGSQVPMALLPAGHRQHSRQRTGHSVGHSARRAADSRAGRCAGSRSAWRETIERKSHAKPVPPGGRYFLCVAGAGPDGAIVNGVDEEFKKSAGILAYWSEGARQFFSYSFPR